MVGLFLEWLYFDAPRSYFKYIKDLSVALFHYFSIPLLMATLFSPWRHDAVDITRVPVRLWAQVIGNNIISRIIGFFVRIGVIIGGIIMLCFINFGALLFFVAWYCLPLVLLASVIYGLQLIARGGV